MIEWWLNKGVVSDNREWGEAHFGSTFAGAGMVLQGGAVVNVSGKIPDRIFWLDFGPVIFLDVPAASSAQCQGLNTFVVHLRHTKQANKDSSYFCTSYDYDSEYEGN